MSNHSAEPTVRWIGPTGGDDIGPCWQRLNREVHLVDAATDRRDIDLTVLACPRPLVDTAAAQQLLEAAGADRFVQLLGVWCEGEGRTGKPVPGAERVFWHAWPAWQRQWLERLPTNTTTPALPFQRHVPKLVRIDTPDGDLAKALIAALATEDIPAVWSRLSLAADADAILWDGAQLSGREADHLGAVCWAARNRSSDDGAAHDRQTPVIAPPVVALLDFPRPETVTAARALGATDVLAKPFTTELLLDTLSTAMRVGRCSSAIDFPSRLTRAGDASRRSCSRCTPTTYVAGSPPIK